MGTWKHVHGTKFEKKNNRKQFFQGTITWSVLKKKKKTFKLKTSIVESASISV